MKLYCYYIIYILINLISIQNYIVVTTHKSSVFEVPNIEIRYTLQYRECAKNITKNIVTKSRIVLIKFNSYVSIKSISDITYHDSRISNEFYCENGPECELNKCILGSEKLPPKTPNYCNEYDDSDELWVFTIVCGKYFFYYEINDRHLKVIKPYIRINNGPKKFKRIKL
jgi:hypothetical protein